MEKTRWLCFGAGAIGTYIGGSLCLADERVVFVEQLSTAAELRQRGLRLDLSADRRRRGSSPLQVAPTSLIMCESLGDALEHGPFDAAIYALKSFDTPDALGTMRPVARDMPPLVCFSNGVENEAALAAVLGTDRVIAGTVTTAVGRRGLGDIVLERLRGIGIVSTHPVSQRLLASTNAALLNPQGFPNAAAMKWSKMLTNLIANPTSAILDMPARQVLEHPGLYRLEIRMLRECLAVMRANRIPVVDLPDTPARILALAIQMPPWASRPLLARAAGAGRGGKMPSFHIDLHSGRGKSEVEYLHGAIVRAGKAAGVPTPINAFLTKTLMSLTRGELALGTYAHDPARFLRAARYESAAA